MPFSGRAAPGGGAMVTGCRARATRRFAAPWSARQGAGSGRRAPLDPAVTAGDAFCNHKPSHGPFLFNKPADFCIVSPKVL
jgi:hypothetical protein